MRCRGRFSIGLPVLRPTRDDCPWISREISSIRDRTPMVRTVPAAHGLSRRRAMLSHTYDYPSILQTSQRINWTLEDVIGAQTFDFSRPFLPDSLAGVGAIRCLDAREKLKLNHIRAFTYLSLFGLVEEYIVPSVLDHVRGGTARLRSGTRVCASARMAG